MQEVISTDKKVNQILILPVFGFVFKSIAAEEPASVLIKMAKIVVHKEETREAAWKTPCLVWLCNMNK